MTTVLIVPEAMQKPDGPYCRILAEAGLTVAFPNAPQMARGKLDHAAMAAELEGVSATIAGGERYTPELMDACPQLRVIARAGVGYDRVDVPSANAHKIAVTITPNANHECVAELTLALLFAVQKRIVINDRGTRAGGWDRVPLGAIRGKTLGIVGLGRIGRSLAVRAIALGMHVVAFDAAPDEQVAKSLGVRLVDFDTLLAESDVVSLHCPLTSDNHGLFNKDVFARMKSGSTLINMARGGLVVEEDLADTLRSGHLLGAGLDVFQQEPPERDNPLFGFDNVVVSPHLGGADELSMVAMGCEAAQAIADLSQGEWPAAAIVNPEIGPDWKF